MASIEQQPTVPLQSTLTQESDNAPNPALRPAVQGDSTATVSSPSSSTPTAPAVFTSTTPTTPASIDAPNGSKISSSTIRPTLVPLGSSSTTTPSAPQPKRFAASNINKKFFEKNSTNSTSGVGTSSNTSASLSSSKTVARPQAPQSTSSHFRLVTAKLTATPQSSTTPGPGWSRPSSAAPPTPAPQPPTTSHTAPQLPHAGKVIQPQRSQGPAGELGSGNKPVWGNVKSAPANKAGDLSKARNDFPTAAEVAQGSLKLKEPVENKTTGSDVASKQSRMEEADTFRGVHLDPNAHHWDEIDEDDDNFLNGVIEFGDGRQYKIESAPVPPTTVSPPPRTSSSPRRSRSPTSAPVSKEERFADDFDRSWPRSRTSPIDNSSRDSAGHVGQPGSASSTMSTISLSPQEPSRVLFNERSNKLEPYSSNQRGSFHKRPDISPTESRFSGRDQGNNMQLLQKGGRGFSHGRHEPPSPSALHSNTEKEFGDRGKHASAMGPPAVPASRGRDMGRQVPPHIELPPPQQQRRLSSRDSKFSNHAPKPSSSSEESARHPSQSPALSHASAAPMISPALELNGHALSNLDEMRKDLMHSAAARAKQRRQQEEEEREKEKERARRKAAELEERFKMTEKPADEATVIAVIEQAVRSAPPPPEPETSLFVSSQEKTRPPALRGLPSHMPSTRNRSSSTAIPTATASTVPSASSTTESWRARAAPLPTPRAAESATSFVAPPPSALEQSLAEAPVADLEVVDFTEMHKFVDDKERHTKHRPVASDFFEDDRTPTTGKAPPESPRLWRKMDLPSQSVTDEQSKPTQMIPSGPESSLPDTHNREKATTLSHSHTHRGHIRHQSAHKDATMSALDDAMSRIKGALDVMQAEDASRPQPVPPSVATEASRSAIQKENKWLPPVLRPPRSQPPSLPSEVFDITAVEPPRSPKPAWNVHNVRLPKNTVASEPLSKKAQILSTKVNALRWSEVLSFDPPVEGMRRDLSLNDVLFRRPGLKAKERYRVSLPKPRSSIPFVQVVLPKGSGTGAFKKFTPDEQSKWRRRVLSPPQEVPDIALDTTSRSPPPEISSEPATVSESTKNGSLRSRSQPKMPAGSSVAFYKDSKVIEANTDSPAAVNFIVTSELDGTTKRAFPSTPPKHPAPAIPFSSAVGSLSSNEIEKPAASQLLTNGIKATELPTSSLPSSAKSESKSSEESNVPATPPTVTWTGSLNLSVKDSPSRGLPDPEHLKAVWSQAPNNAGLKSVNSLEGIGDDLTALPFTLQDVKSEDGETPPPTSSSAPPSRLSLHDVTRAFQQVPSSSSSTAPHRPTISPPSTTAPVARPAPGNYTYPTMPPANPNMRPSTFTPYSPMMSSPSPTVLYSHPIPGSPVPGRMPMNGQPLYPQAMWMPTPNGAPQQSLAGLMRPMPSPYLPQAMPVSYPSPGAQPMYFPHPQPPNMQTPPHPPHQAAIPNRTRTMPGLSPAISHAMPIYGGSPIPMHTPAAATNRGPIRTDNGLPHPPTHHPPPNPFVVSSPFIRPGGTW